MSLREQDAQETSTVLHVLYLQAFMYSGQFTIVNGVMLQRDGERISMSGEY